MSARSKRSNGHFEQWVTSGPKASCVLNCVLNASLAGFPHQAGALQLLFFPNPGRKTVCPLASTLLPPEQKVGGSNPLGRTTFQKTYRSTRKQRVHNRYTTRFGIGLFWGTVRCLPALSALRQLRPSFGPRSGRTWTNRAAEWRYRIGFADAFTLAGALAFLRISASSATAALFTDSGMLC